MSDFSWTASSIDIPEYTEDTIGLSFEWDPTDIEMYLTSSTDDLDLNPDPEFRKIAEEVGIFEQHHVCLRARLEKKDRLTGFRVCKDCGMVWPEPHLPYF